jgi:hypothetical protein
MAIDLHGHLMADNLWLAAARIGEVSGTRESWLARVDLIGKWVCCLSGLSIRRDRDVRRRPIRC